ncbi:hypothetical protein Tco_0443186 [Tanacetum coccineum]
MVEGRLKKVKEVEEDSTDEPNEPDPRDVKIASLKQRIQELEFPQLQQDSPAKEAETEFNVWDDGSEDVNPFGGGNHGFHDDHYDNPFFQEEPIVLVEEESCPVYNTDNEEEESMPVYDTDIEDVIEEEEGFVGKGEFGREEDNIEDVVVVANDLCSSMIQTILKWYLKAPPMVDKLGFKTIKVRGSIRYKESELDAGDTNLDATSTRDE